MTSSSPDILLILGVAIGIAGVSSTMFVKNIRLERLIYWISWIAAAALMSLAVLDRGWRAAALVAAVCLAVACLYAYLRTRYIKIAGRIYAFTIFNSRPDPPADGSPPPPPEIPPGAYGSWLTAPKFWWTIAIFVGAVSVVTLEAGKIGATVGAAAIVTAVTGLVGYIDARERFPIARRQLVQLAVVVLASIPLLLLPPLAYTLTYYLSGGKGLSADRGDEC